MKPKYYLIGGAVRDKLLGLSVKDYDFAVECQSFQQMKDDLVERGIKIFQEREAFLTIRGSHPEYGAVDYVCCRKEGSYTDGRHPDSVEMGTLLDDQKRRDYTVNAMAFDSDGNLIDPFNGKQDLEDKIIRCVGEPEDRLGEDALRIVRAARFFITKGFNFDSKLHDCLLYDQDIINGLLNISRERIYEELRKCFDHDTYATITFFNEFYKIRDIIFRDLKIRLVPKI